jgi:hypothetical protein
MVDRRFSLTLLAVLLVGCPSKEEPKKSDDSKESDKAEKKDEGKQKKKKGKDKDHDGDEDAEHKKQKKEKESSEKKKKKDGDDDDSAATDKKKPDGPLSATYDGEKIEDFKSGIAWVDEGGLRVQLATAPAKCPSNDVPKGTWTLTFFVLPGPGGKFFAGGPVGAFMTMGNQGSSDKGGFAPPYLGQVELEPFTLAADATMKGSVSYAAKVKGKAGKMVPISGSGTFEATVCKDFHDFLYVKGLAADADGDVQGSFGAIALVSKSAVVHLKHDDDNDVDWIDEIDYFESAGVDCDGLTAARKTKHFALLRVKGISSKTPLLGKPQVASPAYVGVDGTIKLFGGQNDRAWVRLDKLSFDKSAKASGAVYAETFPSADSATNGKLAGKFDAIVCKD